ncbi:cytochrome P450 [Lactarius hengduanensis]|nr:cytochrome P450 [Lactarius hengduanensis]
MIPWPSAVIYLADAAIIKEVTTFRAKFPKPISLYKTLSVLEATSCVRRGRLEKRNTRLVWDETIRIMFDLFDNVWGDSPEIVVDHCVDITLPIALFVVGVAGFGRRMTFKDALHNVSSNLLLKMGVPSWAMKLTERTRRVNLAFDELRQYMVEMVDARRSAETKEERHDLFSGLLDAAHDNPDGGVAITEQELIGNMFIFLFAGHEPYLPFHPDEQERLYQQIKEYWSTQMGRLYGPSDQTYENMNRFTLSMAVLNESLRMFTSHRMSSGSKPMTARVISGVVNPQHAAEDTSFTVGNADGGETTFPVPSGTRVRFHVPGLHYNPKYWKDPHTFRPERFLGEWPRNAFLPFSSGARGCLGKRFFETESIAAITVMISRYRVEVKEEPEFLGETFEQRYARITAFDQMVTTTFRILVLGKSQSGKSSLINAVFNVDMAAAPGSQNSNADINVGFSPANNRSLVVHEYSGFESGDAQSLQTIRDFISYRTDADRSALERLHAIWICVPISDAIEKGLGDGVKDIFGVKKGLGEVDIGDNLGTSQDFNDQALASCVNVIHEDIINVWNFDDKEGYLLSRDFMSRMSHLVGDLAGPSANSPDLNGTVVTMAPMDERSVPKQEVNMFFAFIDLA